VTDRSQRITIFPGNDPQTAATTKLHINTYNSSSTFDPNLKIHCDNWWLLKQNTSKKWN